MTHCNTLRKDKQQMEEQKACGDGFTHLRKSIYFRPGLLEAIDKIQKKFKRRNRSDTVAFIIETYLEQNGS